MQLLPRYAIPVALAGLLATADGAAAQSSAQTAEDCAALGNTVIDGGFVTSTAVVPAADALPAYCQVRATALPSISIEVRLPMEGWNGKYYQAGCGGFCGVLGRADAGNGWINAMHPGLAKGYATATSDSGHHGLSVVDAEWAYANRHAERDWGWRSIGETNRVALALIDAFYGATAETSYFQGCSTGGRMANMAALKYPEMFDGIISGAPALDYTGLVALKMAWLVQANTAEDGSQIIEPAKAALIGDEVMKQCDPVDGKTDGLIDDPRACSVDLSALQCTGGATDGCLDEAELETLAKWRQGPRNSAGEQLYPGGVPEGSEAFWWLWLTGKEGGGGRLVPIFAQQFGAYMAFPQDPGPDYTPMDFDFDRDPARLEIMGKVYNSDDPDLSKFRAAGGKMIVWHGWADAIVTPYKTVDWYEKVKTTMGDPETAETVKLFMVPGLDHCGLLPGPGGVSQASLDPFTPLEKWVEDGVEPQSILVE